MEIASQKMAGFALFQKEIAELDEGVHWQRTNFLKVNKRRKGAIDRGPQLHTSYVSRQSHRTRRGRLLHTPYAKK